MQDCFSAHLDNPAISILPIAKANFKDWLASQSKHVAKWVTKTNFTAEPGQICWLPNEGGHADHVLCGIANANDFWSLAALPPALGNHGMYAFANLEHIFNENITQQLLPYLAWGVASTPFNRYKKFNHQHPKLYLSPDINQPALNRLLEAVNLVRNIINTPAEDMGPEQLATVVSEVAAKFDAKLDIKIGDELLEANFPLVHAVGRSSRRLPRLLDLTWGASDAPKVTLVGKGVCFDCGGLNIKSAANMRWQKKDMGGAAHALGLAYLIMSRKLPVRLRLIIPAVENLIDDISLKPGDVIVSRQGLSVEITNTDAEGRLILADALALASEDQPELLMDFATLTGAATVALGPKIASMFSNNTKLAAAIQESSQRVVDPVWYMPLYQEYASYLDSDVADLANSADTPYAGSITAALFLKHFIGDLKNWVHFDFIAYNFQVKPGRWRGAHVMAIRAVYDFLCRQYIKDGD